jgi:hypothetical protein
VGVAGPRSPAHLPGESPSAEEAAAEGRPRHRRPLARAMAKETNAANPMDADYNKTTNWGAMFKLAGFTLTPLALASGQSTPAAVVAGALLAGALIKQTVNSGEAPASYDKAAETEAIKHVHGTSALNRYTRLALGSVYYYSAATSYARMTGSSAAGTYWPQYSDSAVTLAQRGEYLGATQVFGVECAKAGATLVLLFIGGIWLSSGYHAQ